MEIPVQKVILPVFVAVAATAAAVIARGVSLNFFQKWAKKASLQIGEIILGSIKIPSVYWCAAIGLYVGIAVSELPDKYAVFLNKSVHVVVLFSLTIASANLVGKIYRNYILKSNLPLPTTGLAYGILKGTIYAVGILIILAVLGISITPLITALGVGGLAVALALQDTLANLFAGIHILVEKSIRVGDSVKLETGHEGMVEDITWRTARIRMAPNNMVIIPNKKLSESVVTNYSLPARPMSTTLRVAVSYSADLDLVEKILADEVRAAWGAVEGLTPDREPIVWLSDFAESAAIFMLICQITEYGVQGSVQHEMRKRIFRRFKQEGIEIPFPQRIVYIKEERERRGGGRSER